MTLPSLHCRFCGTVLRHLLADLGKMPLVSHYPTREELSEGEAFYPLQAYVCEKCFLVQIGEGPSPEKLFRHYPYFSSYSQSWLEHARGYVEAIIQRLSLDNRSQVIEIASNDGYLLKNFQPRGIPILGIEPAVNVAEVAQAKGIPTLAKFFDSNLARGLAEEGKGADLLIANNVLAHVPTLHDFVEGIKTLLKPKGIATLEFPSLIKILQENQFDTLHHEHFFYFSLGTVEEIFAAHGLAIFDVEEIPTHGGSLRIYAKLQNNEAWPTTSQVEALREKEIRFGLNQLGTYSFFQKQMLRIKEDLIQFLKEAAKAGEKVAAYGAPAKGTVLLNFCGIGPDLVAYTVDRSPLKQGHFIPGVRVPIFSPEKIGETRPDYLLVLPWNLRTEILAQMSEIRGWGGSFVFPIPRLEVVA